MKAARARRMLQNKAALKEEKKAAAIAAGLDWHSDDGNDETEEEHFKEPPLANLRKDEEHHDLIIDLCKTLESLERYHEALNIIKLALKSGHNNLPVEKQEQLRSLGARIGLLSCWVNYRMCLSRAICQKDSLRILPIPQRVSSRDSHEKLDASVMSTHVPTVASVAV
ncbi:uncharacterized protein LOC120193213 [Hibiscus syriacus]|uniref:uncharacterized protein LOC120193213 n=1 Tax=Hibiscus syriacus TaxID=106335 RepID=UPI00192468EE|nr:uncharacterized protein LOC120193213 [Hibiscus syriacus]